MDLKPGRLLAGVTIVGLLALTASSEAPRYGVVVSVHEFPSSCLEAAGSGGCLKWSDPLGWGVCIVGNPGHGCEMVPREVFVDCHRGDRWEDGVCRAPAADVVRDDTIGLGRFSGGDE